MFILLTLLLLGATPGSAHSGPRDVVIIAGVSKAPPLHRRGYFGAHASRKHRRLSEIQEDAIQLFNGDVLDPALSLSTVAPTPSVDDSPTSSPTSSTATNSNNESPSLDTSGATSVESTDGSTLSASAMGLIIGLVSSACCLGGAIYRHSRRQNRKSAESLANVGSFGLAADGGSNETEDDAPEYFL